MEDKYYLELVKLRMERAKELLDEAEKLLDNEAYKSANNRAYYAIEKAINALLIYKKIEVKTHNGAMKMFNVEYVRTENACFTDEDYRVVSKAEQIRNSSDYDDFYVTNKEEARQQVASARYFVEKVEEYFDKQNAAIGAMQFASKIAEENGVSEMVLDEINAEIVMARKEADE